MVVGDDPSVIDCCQFLHFVDFCVVVDTGGPWAEDGDDCIDLVSEFVSNESVGSGLPDGEDASDGEVGVDNGAAIERIIGDDIPFTLSKNLIFWFLLTGEPLDQRILSEMLLNDSITLHILMQLLISKRVGGIQFNNGGVSEEGRDFNSGIKDALDD